MCVNVYSKVYHTIYYVSVCSCVRAQSMIFSIRLCMCEFSTHLSVSLKCLTVLSCPQSVKSREVETSKKGKCDKEKEERRKQRQEVLLGIFDSVFVFIFYTYFGVVLLLFIWLP